MTAILAYIKAVLRWDPDRELDRSIRGLERAAEELRLERDRRRVEARS